MEREGETTAERTSLKKGTEGKVRVLKPLSGLYTSFRLLLINNTL